MEQQEILYVERDKSFRVLMVIGTIMAIFMSIGSFWASQEQFGGLGTSQWLMVCFWAVVSIVLFQSVGAETLKVHFASQTLCYSFGTPLTRRKFVGTYADIANLTLTRYQLSQGRSKYLLALNWRRKDLPKVIIERYFDLEEAYQQMETLASRLNVPARGVNL